MKTIILTLMLTLCAQAQEWDYAFHYRFDSREVLGDTLLDMTYDLLRGRARVFGQFQPDSVFILIKLGDGFYRAMRINWDKGYGHGFNDGLEINDDWQRVMDVGFGVIFGVAIVYGIQKLRSR